LLTRFFGIKMASSSLIIFQRAKLSMRSITYLCWCNWRTFWRKNTVGRSSRRSCSCTTMLRLTGHLQPRRNWPTWASNVLVLRMYPIQSVYNMHVYSFNNVTKFHILWTVHRDTHMWERTTRCTHFINKLFQLNYPRHVSNK